jgi:prepilin-type processing-associated H-X9-DG protein
MANSGIQWAEPRDLDLSNLPPGVSKAKILKSLSVHHAGIHVAFADGHVQFINAAVKGDELKALTTPAGREKVSTDQLHEDSETQ